MYLSKNFNIFILLILASIGNVLGSLFNWYLGKKILIFKDKKWFPISYDKLKKSEKFFQKYGVWSLLLAWVPIIGDPLTMIAGILRIKFIVFITFVTISKFSRYIFIIYLAKLI